MNVGAPFHRRTSLLFVLTRGSTAAQPRRALTNRYLLPSRHICWSEVRGQISRCPAADGGGEAPQHEQQMPFLGRRRVVFRALRGGKQPRWRTAACKRTWTWTGCGGPRVKCWNGSTGPHASGISEDGSTLAAV